MDRDKKGTAALVTVGCLGSKPRSNSTIERDASPAALRLLARAPHCGRYYWKMTRCGRTRSRTNRVRKIPPSNPPRSVNAATRLHDIYRRHISRSFRSFSFASSTVCHCILPGPSGPSAHSGVVHDVARTRATSPAGRRTRVMSYERRPLGGIAQRPGDRLWCDQAANQDQEDYTQHRVISVQHEGVEPGAQSPGAQFDECFWVFPCLPRKSN